MTRGHQHRRHRPTAPGESPQSEALTVFWTLNVLGASAGMFASLLLKAIATTVDLSGRIDQIQAALVFIAGVTSILSIVSYPFLIRLRNYPLPRGIVWYAAIVCVLALGMSFWV